ncbi:uncharacterized protein LOC142326717 [Lycorma delicatula]|uniref:uncharacterized protein LOC142326717 n=1 Tax=Lycorma delicatula TaxID=130591 RepID=UPI003F515A84
MKCFISANEGIYYATLFGDIHSVPVVEDSILSDECKVLCTNSNKCSLDFQSKDISKCGVHRCGTDTKILLCVTVRIPTVTKLVLPEDITILLQCHPQTTIISQTKQIRISPKEVTGRMANIGSRIVATGGSKARFNSQITLFRHGSSGFTRKVTSGDFIILGEELLLQSSINSGDGWKYSRLSNITVQRVINNKGKKSVVDSISLVDLNGCRNPNMINISPWHPIVDPQNDLIVTFLFRVFMFDGMKEGDELIISVQLVACILKHHCYLRTDLCDHNDFKGVSRRKRAADSNTAGWKEDLTFKIIFSKNGHEELLKGSHYRSWIFVSVIASGIFILLISFLIFLVLKFLLHNGSN